MDPQGSSTTPFRQWFLKATGFEPYPYQTRMALAGEGMPSLVHVPTGLGKTEATVLSWLWRRLATNTDVRRRTPRRLVYCLPMRVLVEQTRKRVAEMLANLGLLASAPGDERPPDEPGILDVRRPDWRIAVSVLMGGEDGDDWDMWPERDAILVGTQDMLLSRALLRGYAATRARWPMSFGLLHTDCCWVFDEIQLMGAGLATTAQLEAFRHLFDRDGHGCHSVWMSATMQREWLMTVDFKARVGGLRYLELDEEDLQHPSIRDRRTAPKPLTRCQATMGDIKTLALEVQKAHQAGTRTIIVMNTVNRACELHDEIAKTWGQANGGKLVLLHSRFRPGDRKTAMEEALADPPPPAGTIVVSTQVIEAGVDISATTLFTEVAPWSSLVQRFGRCNRKGEDQGARVFWIDLPRQKAATVAPPYDLEDLRRSVGVLRALNDVGLCSLPPLTLPFEHTHVIRRKDLLDLFDTTPDLAGNDVDIDRFVREVEESDVHVFWRDWSIPHQTPPKTLPAPRSDELCPAPRSDELCPAPIGSDQNPGFRQFAKKHDGQVWRWNFLDRRWEKADTSKIAPGQVFLVHVEAGGYSARRGWDPGSTVRVDPVAPPPGTKGHAPDGTGDDLLSRVCPWQTIADHTTQVCQELERILAEVSLGGDEAMALRHAARWHDRGKAHQVFQEALPDGAPGQGPWAKATGEWHKYKRPHFRHELASALAALLPERTIPPALRDLVAYLVAAHHGKVRVSLRSLPNEVRPEGGKRFARGVWDGDRLPEVDLGDGVIALPVTLSLEPMEIGLCKEPPFAGQPSWAERVLGLRDTMGPFRLAYLEAVLRGADMRVSRAQAGQPCSSGKGRG